MYEKLNYKNDDNDDDGQQTKFEQKSWLEPLNTGERKMRHPSLLKMKYDSKEYISWKRFTI